MTSTDRWGRRTDENFLPALKHRERKGRLEADLPLPKETQKGRTWRSIDQREALGKDGCASVVVALVRGHGRSFDGLSARVAFVLVSAGPNCRLQMQRVQAVEVTDHRQRSDW